MHRIEEESRLGELVLRDHVFELPLRHDAAGSPTLEVFAREVVAPGGEGRPYLVFFQGGPGFESPRPSAGALHGTRRGEGWIGRALEDHRVLLLDQRGTGRSSPVEIGALPEDPEAQAEHLAQFRADSIVRDAEAIRRVLSGDDGRWSVLGQSFGGFCVVHYLSSAPEHLDAAYITGGLPPLDAHADDVYARTFATLARKNERYFSRFPRDRERLERIAAHLREHDVLLPGGDRFTVGRLQSLGMLLGRGTGDETLHWLLERAFLPSERLSPTFLRGVENQAAFDTNPLYAAIHESCYAQGRSTRWSAQRALEARPEFHTDTEPLLLTGEMIFPEMFEDQVALRPWAGAAHALAGRGDWPRLYDAERLARNDVPVAAAVYGDDLFVDRELSIQTAERIGAMRRWITDSYEHDGLRADGERVLGRLMDLVRSA